MSAISSFPTISGGLPTSLDLAPSIIFVVAYALLLPLSIFRAISYRRPGRLLYIVIRLTIFICVRIATFSLRAVEAHNASRNGGDPDPSNELGIFIAEQILLGIGYIVLINIIGELIRFQLSRTDYGSPAINPNGGRHPRFSLGNIMRLMHLTLLVAIALGIVAGTEYSSAINNPASSNQVKTYRTASTIIALVISALSALVSAYTIFAHPHLPRRSALYLTLISLTILVVPAYRLATILASTPASQTLANLVSTKTKVKFWVLQALFEWLSSALLLAIDWRTWFGIRGTLVTTPAGAPISQQGEYTNGNGTEYPKGEYPTTVQPSA